MQNMVRHLKRTTTLPLRQVPCNGGTLCCQGDAVRLEPEDMGRLDMRAWDQGTKLLKQR